MGGERDPRSWRLRNYRIKADEATIAKSLQGHWREEHIFELTQALELYRVYQDKLPSATGRLKPSWNGLRTAATANLRLPMVKSPIRGTRRASMSGHHLYQMTGVDLTRIDGVDAYTALKVISEIGADMTEMAQRQAPWLGLSPNNRVTGGKVISSKTKPSANRWPPRPCVWRPTRCTAPTAP